MCVRTHRGTHPCYMSIANIAWSSGVIMNSCFLSPPVITLNILCDTSEPKTRCYLNFPVDLSTDFSAHGLGPYVTCPCGPQQCFLALLDLAALKPFSRVKFGKFS